MRGLKDIKTSTGKNSGKRRGVGGIVPGISIGLGSRPARRVVSQRGTGLDDWGGDVNQHLVNAGKNPPSKGNGYRKVALQLIMRLLADIKECRQFCEEKIPGARRRLCALQEKLANLQKEAQ